MAFAAKALRDLRGGSDLSACKRCPGWEKWGKTATPTKSDDVALQEECASEAATAACTSPRSGTTGTPRKDECASEVPTAGLTTPRSANTGSPKYTPRMTPPGSPRAAQPAPPKNNRRSSRVSFVENLGLSMDSDEELAGFEDMVQESITATFSMTPRVPGCDDPEVKQVMMGESDDETDEDSDEDGDIFDEYDFDHTKLAEMVKAGAEREKLTSAIEEAMAASLERKLKTKATAPIKEVISKDNPFATGAVRPGEMMYEDLSGRMTPGRATPTEDEERTAASPEAVAEHMQQAVESAQARRRRSSAAKKGVDVISQAKQIAAVKRRESLSARMGASPGNDMQEAISEAMQTANRRHRKSISKAADVLDDAGYGDGMQVVDVTKQMGMIEVAMEEARRRHRRSIAHAVQQLEEPTWNADAKEFTPQKEPGMNSCAQEFVPPSMAQSPGGYQQTNACAQEFVPPSMAQSPGGYQQTGAMQCEQESWNGQNGWQPSSSPYQSTINQAITSAYQSHCTAEQQCEGSYGGGYYDAGWQGSPDQYNQSNQQGYDQYNQQNFGQQTYTQPNFDQSNQCSQSGGHQTYTQPNFDQSNQCSQSGHLAYGMNNQPCQGEWSQAGSCQQYPQGGQASNFDMYSQCNGQTSVGNHYSQESYNQAVPAQCNGQTSVGNQYSQESYNQGSSWECSGNTWSPDGVSTCDGFVYQ